MESQKMTPAPRHLLIAIFASVCTAGTIAAAAAGASFGVMLVGLWIAGPLWVPGVFAVYAFARGAVTAKLVLAFAIVEVATVWWAYAIATYF
jgi:hypothetical protein